MKNSLAAIARSLRGFKGNARTCILTEPMWGISYNLFVPYASLYALALGVNEAQIGLIATVGMALQMVWAFSAGAITDRLGRRKTSLIFDCLSWSVPTAIWAFAQNFTFFLVAAILNSMVRVVHISWSCLFIEDSDSDRRVSLYTWISVASTLAGFFAPIAGLLVTRFGLVPATRGLYLFAFAMMTAMFFIRNAFVTETTVGRTKMQEAQGSSLKDILAEYREAARELFGHRETRIALGLSILSNIHLQTRNTFASVVMTRGAGLSEGLIAVFPPVASVLTLAVYLLVIPRVTHVRRALTVSLGLNILGNLLLFAAPAWSSGAVSCLAAISASVILIAIGTGVTGPVIDAVLANSVSDTRRATMLALVYTLMYAVSAPFGALAGILAQHGERLPALLTSLTMGAAFLLALALGAKRKD